MSGHAGSVISESGIVKNIGVTAKIASPVLSVQKLFPLPVLVADILGSDAGQCRAMSSVSHLSRAWSKSWG